jgi:methionine-gamma-lyase
MKNYSGILTFQLKDEQEVEKVIGKLQVIHHAVSLGHHRSLIFYLKSKDLLQTSFRLTTPKQYDSWNSFMGNGIFRLSTGLENIEDLIADLEQALDN